MVHLEQRDQFDVLQVGQLIALVLEVQCDKQT